MIDLARRSVLVVGIGGLGCPAAIALARAGVGTLGVADDDEVEEVNLHRQILFSARDVGSKKTQAAARAIEGWAGRAPATSTEGPRVVVHDTRILPSNAENVVSAYDLVVEGSDNFATKFMVADACAIAGVPVVHGAAVRWHGTALAVGRAGRPCYRCLFEDLPREHAPACAEAGVLGPVVGIIGAIQAALAVALLAGDDVAGTLVTFDGKTDVMRRRRVAARPYCELCGASAGIRSLDATRYVATCPGGGSSHAGVTTDIG